MIQPELNNTFSPKEIASFVIDNDKDKLFLSAKANFQSFVDAVQKMQDVGQIIVFNNNGLWGVLGWCFTSEERKNELSKQVWRLPENIVDGDILYLSFIATNGNCNVLAVRKLLLEDLNYKDRITYKRGFTKNGWYQHKIFKK